MSNVLNRFALNPTNINIQRSIFNRPSGHKTTFNTGELIPIYIDEILPGDTFKMTLSAVVRMTTPIHPVMDNAYFDYYWFFVPRRLVIDKWVEIMGENKESYWTQPVEYTIPQIFFDSTYGASYSLNDIACYMGVPPRIMFDYSSDNKYGIDVSYFRAYALIWNEFFRDQNTQEPIYIDKGVDDFVFSGGSGVPESVDRNDFIKSAALGFKLAPLNKYHDYFTSALPEPQKGPAVSIPISGQFPVFAGSPNRYDELIPDSLGSATNSMSFKMFKNSDGTLGGPSAENTNLYLHRNVAGQYSMINHETGNTAGIEYVPVPNNLYADLSAGDLEATINELRLAFAVQKFFERDARGGTRYIELLKSHFGVQSSDARLQRPEFLGGKRVPINMVQVLQTSSTDDVSPQGNTAAYSLTATVHYDFTKSFEEHGMLICVGGVRTDHTYQQGIDRILTRRRRLDFYFPAFANIGEQPIRNREIYADGSDDDLGVFGYQEAWAEYRYKPSRVSGSFYSSNSSLTGLASWTYVDVFNSRPVLNSDFMKETYLNVARTLAISNPSLAPQFFADFHFDCVCTRPMPMYSIPGLLDHN